MDEEARSVSEKVPRHVNRRRDHAARRFMPLGPRRLPDRRLKIGQNGGTNKVPSSLRFRAFGAPRSLPGRLLQSEA